MDIEYIILIGVGAVLSILGYFFNEKMTAMIALVREVLDAIEDKKVTSEELDRIKEAFREVVGKEESKDES